MEVNENIQGLIQSSRVMMIFCVVISFSAIVLLLISSVYSEREENLEVIAVIRRYLPKKLVEWYDKT